MNNESNIINHVVIFSGDVNIDKLDKELKTIEPTVLAVAHHLNTVTVLLSDEPPAAVINSINTIILTHDPFSIDQARLEGKKKVDQIFEDKVNEGFSYQGIKLSITPESRGNWTALLNFKSGLEYPYPIVDMNDAGIIYLSSQTDLDLLYQSLGGYYMQLFSSKGNSKLQIQSATTQQEIDTIIGNIT